MFYLIASLLIGIHLSPFLLPKLPPWIAQGFCFMFTSIACLAWNSQRKAETAKNIPLIIFILYATANTLLFNHIAILAKNTYIIKNIIIYLNILCAFIIYQSITSLSKDDIKRLLNISAWIVLANVFLCSLQVFELFPYLKLRFPENLNYNNLVIGFIGNGTHLSGYLGMSLPLLLYKPCRRNYLAIALIMVILFFYTGTSKGDIAMGGFISGFLACLYFIVKEYRIKSKQFISFAAIITLLTIGGLALLKYHTHFDFFSNNGRTPLWAYYWNFFKGDAVIGIGLSFVDSYAQYSLRPSAHHLHNEFYQVALELGLVGFISLLAII